MDKIFSAKQIQSKISDIKKSGKKIGFVPTMGFLHEGHASLLRRAKKENDIVICSIYVNPQQFGPGEDYEGYPRDLAGDTKLLEKAGTDILFHPQNNEEIYPGGYKKEIPTLPDYCQVFEGKRPGNFFLGVAQVVSRLFDLIPADHAYFGQKDYQQSLMVQWLVKTLNYPVKIMVCPIIREKSGLAISSRNSYLTAEEKKTAPILYRTLLQVKEWISAGERIVENLERRMTEMILSEKMVQRINYLGIREKINLKPIFDVEEGKAVALIGVKIGQTNLIDNLLL